MLGGFEVGLTSLFQAWFQVVMNFKIWSIWAFHGALRKATLAVPSDFESPKNCTWMSQELSKWSVNGLWSQYTTFTSIAARGGGGSFKRLKLYNSEEHVPIESFVTTLIHWTFFLMTRTKLAFVGFVAAGNSMWHQVLDDLCLVVTDQSATTWDSSYAPNSTQYNSVLQSSEKCYPSTILYYKVLLQKVLLQYYKVLLQYYSVLQSTSPVYYSVLQSTTPVLQITTKYYSSNTPNYKVLLHYYSVLQSTTPVLLRTTKYYSSTTLYYKELQSTSPVLLRTTKYYSSTTPYYKVLVQYYFVLQSTTPYYKVLLQYYFVLQRTTPVLLRTTKYYKVLVQYYFVLQSTTPVLLQYYSVLQRATPVLLRATKDYSSTTLVLLRTTKYCTPVLLRTTKNYKVLVQYYSVLQSTTPVLLRITKDLQYYKALVQYYFVLQSTSPVLLRTTKYYFSTTSYYKGLLQYYKVLVQYYFVLQSTSPVLLRTTNYYSSTTSYYKVLYSVLQTTSPVLLRTTKY